MIKISKEEYDDMVNTLDLYLKDICRYAKERNEAIELNKALIKEIEMLLATIEEIKNIITEKEE